MLQKVCDYANEVLNGKIPACKWVKLAAQRFLNDLKSPEFTFNNDAYESALGFIQAQKHTKGEWKGQNLILEDWQRFIVANLFGLLREDGRRKYTRAYICVPKKNGKSPLVAAIGNLMLMDEEDGSPEVYSIATKLDQASIVWEYAANMFKGLISDFDVDGQVTSSFNNKRIIHNGGVFRPLAYDENDSNDGYSVSCGIIDEWHAHRSGKGYDILSNGVASKKSPLILAITTAGHDKESACYKHQEYCQKVLEGVFIDSNLFALIFTIDEGDQWDSEDTRKKANPNYGVSVKPEYLESQIAEARESGIKRDTFMIKHLNCWVDAYDTWISTTDWKAAFEAFEIPDGSRVHCGLDLASSGDFTALTFDWENEGVHRIKTKYYLPELKIKEWVGETGAQIRQWVRDGWITQTPGNTTDYDYLEKDLKEHCAKFEVIAVGFDPWNSKQLAAKLYEDGINMKAFSQAITYMHLPTKTFEELVLGGKLKHDGNPVTAWMMTNVEIYRDANLNMKVKKKDDKNKKVDGVVSAIMAVGEAIDEANKKETWFESQII